MLRPEERKALVGVDAPVLAVGDDGRISFVARGALQALGWDASLVGHPPRILVPAARRPAYESTYGQLARGHWPAGGLASVRTFLAQDGDERSLHSQVAAFERPDGSRFLCATMAPDARQASLEPVVLALAVIGYKRLTPPMG